MADLIHSWRNAALVAAITTIAAALAAPPVSAQSLYGAIIGTVADPSGAPVPAATVTATNTGTGLEVDTQSDTDGDFAFRNLQPGVYDVRTSRPGFKEMRKTGVRVVAGNPLRIDLELEIGTVAEAVTVTAESTLPPDGEGRPSHRDHLEGIGQPSPQPVPELPGAAQPRPGRHAGPAPERGDRHSRPRADHHHQRHGAQQQRVPHRRRGVGQCLAAAPRRLRPVRGDDRDGQRLDEQLRRRPGHGGRRRRHRAHEVRHQRAPRLRRSSSATRTSSTPTPSTTTRRPGAGPQSTNIYGGTLGGPIIRNRLFFFGGCERYAAARGTEITYSRARRVRMSERRFQRGVPGSTPPSASTTPSRAMRAAWGASGSRTTPSRRT